VKAKKKKRKKENLLDISIKDFWCKKVVKCNIKIKNIKPTPKSITHKKPTRISQSWINIKKPKNIK